MPEINDSSSNPVTQQPATPAKGGITAKKDFTLKDVMEQLLDNKSDIRALSHSIESMKTSISNVEQQVNDVKSDLAKVIEDVSDAKVDHIALSGRVQDLEDAATSTDDSVAAVTSLCQQNKRTIEKLQIANINNVFRSMQCNVIAQNVCEVENESNEECMKQVHNVINNVFKIKSKDIAISVAHRMGKPNVNGRRPIIFKLARRSDKDILWKNIKNVATYNSTFKSNRVFIDMTQLPKKLANDKDSLMEDFKLAKKAGNDPKWKYDKEKGQYCYIVDNTYYRPKVDFFLI